MGPIGLIKQDSLYKLTKNKKNITFKVNIEILKLYDHSNNEIPPKYWHRFIIDNTTKKFKQTQHDKNEKIETLQRKIQSLQKEINSLRHYEEKKRKKRKKKEKHPRSRSDVDQLSHFNRNYNHIPFQSQPFYPFNDSRSVDKLRSDKKTEKKTK